MVTSSPTASAGSTSDHCGLADVLGLNPAAKCLTVRADRRKAPRPVKPPASIWRTVLSTHYRVLASRSRSSSSVFMLF